MTLRRPIPQILLCVLLVGLCVGAAKPHTDGVEEIVRQRTPVVHLIGDRAEVKGILEAVRAGYDLAREL